VRQLRQRGGLGARLKPGLVPSASGARVALDVVVAATFAAALLAGCGSNDAAPVELLVESERIAELDGPDDWSPLVPEQLTDGQFLREVDGRTLIFAGDVDAGGDVDALSAGTAWRSPALVGADAVADACAVMPAFAASSGFAGAVTEDDLADCRALPDDPQLRTGFVTSFADAVVPQGGGNRSFGAGVLLDEDGSITVVVTVAFGLDR
jgi:hypothetical protein